MTLALRHLWWSILLSALLVRLYLTPEPPDVDSLLSNIGHTRSVLVLTAHPDDEAMFFSPSILHLVKHGWDVRGLCLSIGNATGLGEVRRRELHESYRILGIPADHVHYIDDPSLQDGMRNHWDPQSDVLPPLQAHLSKYPASTILTFDDHGITKHPNHMALPAAATLVSGTRVVTLRSPSLVNKFTGPLWIIYTRLGRQSLDETVVVSSPAEWWTGIRAMLEHRSQLVWFRWLYLGFSRLMWVNELVLHQKA